MDNHNVIVGLSLFLKTQKTSIGDQNTNLQVEHMISLVLIHIHPLLGLYEIQKHSGTTEFINHVSVSSSLTIFLDSILFITLSDYIDHSTT